MKVYEWVSHLYYRVYWSCFFTRLVGTWVVGVPRQHRYGYRPWGSRDRRAPLRAPQLTQRHLRCSCLAPDAPPWGRGVISVASGARAWHRSHVLPRPAPFAGPRTRTQIRMHRLLSIQNSGVAPIALTCLALRGGCVNTPAVRHRSDVLLWTSALPGRQSWSPLGARLPSPWLSSPVHRYSAAPAAAATAEGAAYSLYGWAAVAYSMGAACLLYCTTPLVCLSFFLPFYV
jgi:hypothetical protein